MEPGKVNNGKEMMYPLPECYEYIFQFPGKEAQLIVGEMITRCPACGRLTKVYFENCKCEMCGNPLEIDIEGGE